MKETSCKFVGQSYLARPCSEARIEWVKAGQEVLGRRAEKAGNAIIGRLKNQTVEVFEKAEAVLQDFANVQSEPKDIVRFVKRYGVLRQDDLELIEPPDERPTLTGNFLMSCDGWLYYQNKFRSYWDLDPSAEHGLAEQISFELGLYGSAPTPLDVQVVASTRGLQLRLEPVDLWQALCLMLVNFADRLRKCKNPTCPSSPYFIATRRDQKFCNEACARLVANRVWWNKSGPQWRKGQQKKKPKGRGPAKR